MLEEQEMNLNKYQLDNCLFFSTVKLARELNKIADETFAITGLSPSHAMLLHIINDKGGVQQKVIGETLHLTPSTITRLIEKLEHKGYVAKQSEGKSVFLCETKEGQAMQKTLSAAFDQLHAVYEDILTPEETLTFLTLSNKLLNHLE